MRKGKEAEKGETVGSNGLLELWWPGRDLALLEASLRQAG